MNKRKFFGAVLGIMLWSVCVVFFTFAYYEWKSENTSIVLGINDLTTKCIIGDNVNVTNIGPVLDYRDGVKAEFSIANAMSKEMAIDLRLDITSISDNLLTKSFKYAVVTDTKGGTNYDYTNPVLEGDFTNFKVGTNIITKALVIEKTITQYFQFIVYIDGNMKNDSNMQNNSLEADLMIGNCDENATALEEMAYQAIYSSDDNSLTFIYNKRLNVGDTYNDKTVTSVYTGFDTSTYRNTSAVPWYSDGNYANITSVVFENEVSPVSTTNWFNGFSKLTSINLEKLDTSKVTIMASMFYNCRSLTSLDLSSFDTSNVTDMSYMFYYCESLTTLDLSNFNTAKVTNMESMVQYCKNLINLNLSNFNTSNVTIMYAMFAQCNVLENITLNNGFDFSKVSNTKYMFYVCSELNFEITINNSGISKYADMFKYAATSTGAKITVNYTSATESLVDSMIATKSTNSNVAKGICVDCKEETTE